MSENERQQRMVERVLEDEGLRGDLEDSAASALVDWASKRAEAAAADPARPNDAVEADVQSIRAAAREAARSGETDPKQLIAKAEALLTPGQGGTPASGKAPAPAAPPATEPTSQPAPAGPSTTMPAPSGRADRSLSRPSGAATRPAGRRWQRFTGWLKRKRKDH